MSVSFFSVVGSTYLLASFNVAHANCSPSLNAQIESAERIVDSLRPEKAGQMRVFASDGSEYPAGEALWMKGQLKSVLRSCANGQEDAAASQLQGVTKLLKAHHATT